MACRLPSIFLFEGFATQREMREFADQLERQVNQDASD